MFRRFVVSCICLTISVPVFSQTFSLSTECQEAVRSAENIRNPDIYTACGFDDRQKALGEWSLWAEKEKAGQAFYEICTRHPSSYSAESYCQKAMELGNGPALLRHANSLYEKKDYKGAATFYTRALKSPLLNNAEKGQIAQNMGLLYMNPESSYYNPKKGMPLIEKAISRRGAEANNLMGVYALFGLQGVPQNSEKSFEYFWRSLLLGCPSAEENLGLFHLYKQRKIDNKTAYQNMTERMFSCTPPKFVEPESIEENNCNCNEVYERERLAKLYPYRLIKISPDMENATLLDKKNKKFDVKKSTKLQDNMVVSEIRQKALVLLTSQTRTVLNLAPIDNCPEICEKKDKLNTVKTKTIKPYRLTFSTHECSDILYYAERLVDTNLPFTGKEECKFSADMDKASEMLLNL